MKKLLILEIWCGQNVNLLFVIFFILFDDFMPLKFGDFWRFVHSPGDERDTQNISLNWSIPQICPFWYSATWFRPVNSTPKSAQIRNKIALIGQNESKFRVLYAKHRKNCECCPGHSLTVSQLSKSLSLCHCSHCSHCSQCLLVSISVY